jgi:hypothetical protein
LRLIISAFNGPEYNTIEKHNLKNIKQRIDGKVVVPLTRTKHGEMPISPVVWASFLKGIDTSDKYTAEDMVKWNNPIINFFEKLYNLHPSIRLKKHLTKLGFRKSPNRMSGETLFDLGNYLAIDVPMWNYNPYNP